MSVSDAAATGDARKTLEAMRDKLAEQMDRSDPAVTAQISGQLVKVLEALDALPAAEESTIDELASRRKDRRAKTRTGTRSAAR